MRLGLILFCSGLLLAQTASTPQDKCRVEGKVLNSVTGEPVRRARVTLRLNPAAPMGVGGVGLTPSGGMTGAMASSAMIGGSNAPAAAANPSSSAFPQLPTFGAGNPRPAPITTATDAEGRFVFTNVDPGDYQIAAQRDNFQYTAPRRPEPVSLKPGDAKKDVVLKVAPLGVIAGSVRDENGDPVQNVQVSLMTWQYNAAGRQLTARGSAPTNDLGEYRLFGVTPGKYYLRASPPTRRTTDEDDTFAISFYPGALDPSGASALDLRPGQEMRGIDLMARRARTVTARGRVVKPVGASSVTVGIGQTTDNGSMNTTNSLGDPEGKFEWRGMIPGAYTLTAQATVGEKRYTVRYPLQVGSMDIDNIELRLAPALDWKGAIRIEGNTETKLAQVTVRFEGRSGRSSSTSPGRITMVDGRSISLGGGVADDGTFSLSLDPDFYRISATAPGALYLKSVTCGSTDATEAGIDLAESGACDVTVVMSANSGQIDGQVTDENSQPAPSVQVTLVATGSRRSDLFKLGITDATGHFSMKGLAPGSYKVYAWEEVDSNAVRYDPEFVKPYESSGQTVQIAEGGKESVTLKQIKKPADR